MGLRSAVPGQGAEMLLSVGKFRQQCGFLLPPSPAEEQGGRAKGDVLHAADGSGSWQGPWGDTAGTPRKQRHWPRVCAPPVWP